MSKLTDVLQEAIENVVAVFKKEQSIEEALDGDEVAVLALLFRLHSNWHQGNLTDKEYEILKQCYEVPDWDEGTGFLQMIIRVDSFLDGEHQEELEDKVKEVLENFGVAGKIKSSTGNDITIGGKNETRTR